ncbi:MAG: methionine--tRNA ligase [Parcubacteria group bacterium]
MPKEKRKKKKFYIAEAIAYVNGRPHIGHALEAVQADVIARYMRSEGYDVFFGTGTDEHGDKNNRMALASGKATQQFVSEMSGYFKSLKKALALSWDNFIRTSDRKKHWPGALELWEKLQKKGDIYKRDYEGLYCVGCEKFLTEKDLVNGECPLHKKAPEKVSEKNYFFRLSRYAREVEQAITSDRLKIFPEARKNEVLSFIREGLNDVSFSRTKKTVPWGIPVPGDDQTMYVWCDALSNYLSAVGYGRDEYEFKKWWPTDVNLIGKDILRFHAVYFLAMLISAGLPLPKTLMVHGYITAEGEKISKTLGNVIDPFEAAEKYGIDALRYYMLREIPSDGDGDFSWEKFHTRYNDDLAKGVGNFVSRVANLLSSEKITVKSPVSKEVKAEIKRMEARVRKHVLEFRLHDALSAIFDLIKFGDGYINRTEPWKNPSSKTSRDLAELAVATGKALVPFMPGTGEKILKIFSVKSGKIISKKTRPLFPRV